MSVLIKGMQMPDECRMCAMCEFYGVTGKTICKLTHAVLAEYYETIAFDGRHKNCPLVEVKEDGE